MTVPSLKSVHLEITTRCGARCPVCPHHTLPLTRRNRDMPLGVILDIACQARAAGAKEVHPHLLGEPTMHKRFIAVLDGLRRECPDMLIGQYTNGWGLANPDIRQAILRNVDRLVISIDGADDETMRATRPGLKPERIAAGVRALYAEKGGVRPKITIRATRMPINDGTLGVGGPWRERWAPFCDSFDTVPVLDYVEGVVSAAPLRGSAPCPCLFDRLIVAVDGKAIMCFVDRECEAPVGDLYRQTVAEVWAGEPMQRLRELHATGKAEEIPMCRTCRVPGVLKG